MTTPATTPKNARRRGLRCEAVALPDVAAPADKPHGWAGRWRINTGKPMPQYGIANATGIDRPDELVLVILDLSTATPARPVIPANWMHWGDEAVGKWIDIQASAAGLDASLILYVPTDEDQETTKERLSRASYVYDLLRRDHPFEISIEGDEYESCHYEPITEPTEINGQLYDPAAYDLPLYVARDCLIKGAAVVDYGADTATVRLAARSPQSPAATPAHKDTPTMTPKERLAALKAKHPAKHHGLIARLICEEAKDEEIDHQVAVEAITAERDEAQAAIEAKDTEIAALTARIAALEASDEDEDEETAPAGGIAARGKRGITAGGTATPVGTGSSDGDETAAPKTIKDAYRILARDNVTGMRARQVALQRWPDLRKDPALAHLA